MKNLLADIKYRDRWDRNSLSIEGICAYSSLFKDSGLRDICCYMSAYINTLNDNNKKDGILRNGIIELPALAVTQKMKKEEIDWRIDYVFKDANKREREIAYLPLLIAKRNNNKNDVLYSIYTLFAAIGEIVRRKESIKSGNLFNELSQLRAYPMPLDYKNNTDNTRDTDGFDIDSLNSPENKEDLSGNELKNKMYDWVNLFYDDNIVLSQYLLGKISTRFFNAVDNISGNKFDNLGDIMHYIIVALFNTVLIEEAKEKEINMKDMNINNTKYSCNILVDNIKSIESQEKTSHNIKNLLLFTKWIFKCPLLVAYLNYVDRSTKKIKINDATTNDRTLMYYISKFLSTDDSTYEIKIESIYYKLREVLFKKENDTNNESQNTNIQLIGPFIGLGKTGKNRVIKYFKDNNYPYTLFVKKDNAEEQAVADDFAIEKICNLFSDKDKIKRQHIKNFRKYLEDNNITW